MLNICSFLNIVRNKAYSINKLQHYSLSDCTNYSVTVFDYSDNDLIVLPNEEFYNTFRVTANSKWYDIYNDLYKLIINVNGSKNTYKKLSKCIDVAIEKEKDTIDFKGLKDIEMDSAILFMNYLKKELEYRKEPHKLIF